MITHTTETVGDALVVRLVGRLDTEAASDLDAQFDVWIAGDCRKIVLDLSGLTYTSSIGLRCIIRAAKALRPAGRELVLFNPQPMVKEVFRISGLSALIPVQEADPAGPPKTA